MNEIIDKLKNMPFVTGLFVTGLREGSGNIYLTIHISKVLIIGKESIPKLYYLLNSQKFFDWTVSMTD